MTPAQLSAHDWFTIAPRHRTEERLVQHIQLAIDAATTELLNTASVWRNRAIKAETELAGNDQFGKDYEIQGREF